MSRSLRMRIFAGPNGSGKSTMFKDVKNFKVNGRSIDFGVYINPDEVARSLKTERRVDLEAFDLDSGKREFERYLPLTTLVPAKIGLSEVRSSIQWNGPALTIAAGSNVDRIAQLVTQFVCDELLRTERKFTFETVFSDASKLAIMDRANALGYKTYLYFVSTSHPEINKSRVKIRVSQGGHDVPEKTIEERYYRSLGLLAPAIRRSYHAFIYDNTEKLVHFAEYKNDAGRPYWWLDVAHRPFWFQEYYLTRVSAAKAPDDFEALNQAAIAWALRS